MNMMNPYQKYIKKNEKFPVSELLFNSSISLPSAYDVKLKDITIVSNFLKNFKNLIDK